MKLWPFTRGYTEEDRAFQRPSARYQSVAMTVPEKPASETLVYRRSDFDDGHHGPFPEDLRTWQPAVRLIKLVEQATRDLPAEAAPNPAARALAGVLLWCLATGRYGSWDIEALCDEEPMCHHLAAGFSPTHVDIHRFRREHEEPLEAALATLLGSAWTPQPGTPAPDFVAEAVRRYQCARLADTLPPE